MNQVAFFSKLMASYTKFFSKFSEASPKKTYRPLAPTIVKDFNAQRPGGAQEMLCYAPFKSMRFDLRGKVVACCHNSKESYGKYPEQSIKEIWNSQQVKTLRKHICNNDLSYGCQVCSLDFESRNFNAVRTHLYDHHPVNDEYPTMMDFMLENTCNLECEMCSGVFSSSIRKNREGKKNKSGPYDENFIEQLREFIPHLSDARFTGGEPFLIGRYFEIWELIAELNPACKITVQTNGNVLNKKVKNALLRGNFGINVSIESLDRENYSAIMKNGDLDTALENIKWFSNYCQQRNTYFAITICPMRQNWKELPALVRLCNDMNALAWFSIVYAPASCALWTMSFEELNEVYNTLVPTDLPQATLLEEQNRRYFDGILTSIDGWRSDALEREADKAGDELGAADMKDSILLRFASYLDNSGAAVAEREARMQTFTQKIASVLQRLEGEKLPADAWKRIQMIFADELIMEVYEGDTEQRLYADLKVLVSKGK